MVCETGANVHGIVFDTASNNIGKANRLGWQLTSLMYHSNIQQLLEKKINAIFDICHMIKLVRNASSDFSAFVTSNGENISWKYILALYKILENDVLHLGNKFKSKHLKWQKHKMKVSVTAQALKHSVSAAIKL